MGHYPCESSSWYKYLAPYMFIIDFPMKVTIPETLRNLLVDFHIRSFKLYCNIRWLLLASLRGENSSEKIIIKGSPFHTSIKDFRSLKVEFWKKQAENVKLELEVKLLPELNFMSHSGFIHASSFECVRGEGLYYGIYAFTDITCIELTISTVGYLFV